MDQLLVSTLAHFPEERPLRQVVPVKTTSYEQSLFLVGDQQTLN